jgi:LysM repeat protein
MILRHISVIVLLLLVSYVFVLSAPYDSLGIRKEGKISYIIHKVDAGETVYSITRRYKITQDLLIKTNPSIRNGLKVGDEIRIPLTQASVEKEDQYFIHTVQPSETLFSIAKKYGVSVEQIKKWNDISDNNIAVNQKLKIQSSSVDHNQNNPGTAKSTTIHIVNKGETIYSIAKLYNITTDNIIRWNALKGNDLKIGQELIVKVTDQNTDKKNPVIANELKVKEENKIETPVVEKEVTKVTEIKPEKRIEKEGEFQKVVEKGMAEVIEGSETTKKYLAMHRNAPVGTIMQVRNEMNNLTVFVRIIGKLPDSGDNLNVAIRISKTAYDRLGAIDKRFPVEITYLP